MISRYALYRTSGLSDYFQLSEGLPKGVKPHYNISPTMSAPVIVNQEGVRVVKPMKWGLVAQGAKDTNSVFRYKTFNVPSEKIFSRHSWERAVREARCLVPADGYYELDGEEKKRAWYVQPNDKEMLAFAGVYSSWEDPEGVTHGTYSIITIEVDDYNRSVPVIITREDQARWLDPAVTDISSLYDMLRLYPRELLTVYGVSSAVYSPKLDQSDLIKRL